MTRGSSHVVFPGRAMGQPVGELGGRRGGLLKGEGGGNRSQVVAGERRGERGRSSVPDGPVALGYGVRDAQEGGAHHLEGFVAHG